jgi:energy-coupling factor transporter transmembrane protein EcfT
MSNKTKKVLLTVGLCLFVLLTAALLVCLHFWPEQTKTYLKTAWDWLNQPLPVVGVSTLMILFFVWRIFASTSLGKKQINQFKRGTEDVIREFNDYKAATETIITEYRKELTDYKTLLEQVDEKYGGIIKSICESSRNVRIKKIGESINGEERKETTNNETNPGEE